MKTEENCFEPGDLVEYKHMIDHVYRFSIERDAAILLEHSVSDDDVTLGERMITKLLTPYDIQMVYNDAIRLISKEEQDVGK